MTLRTTILMAGLLLPLAASAQEWRTYTYKDPGFTIGFPGVPAIESSRIKNALGLTLPMTRYEVRQDHIVYTLSVVNYSLTNADALTTIVETERTLSAGEKKTESRGARIRRVFGRKLTLEGSDGSRSAIAIFFVDKHLYTVIGKALPPTPNEESDDSLRFLESLQFADDSGGWFGGLSGLFGGGSSDSDSVGRRGNERSNGDAPGYGGRDRGSDNITSGSSNSSEPRPRPAPPPAPAPAQAADASCAGKSAGDTVQLQTPGGPVAAICTLVARPIAPATPAH